MIRRTLIAAAAALAALALAASAGAAPRHDLRIGISPQTLANPKDYALMRAAGLRSVRLPLDWGIVENHSPYLVRPDWSEFDREVAVAAEFGMTAFPFIWGTPGWISDEGRVEPVYTGWAAGAWASFLRRTVLRYGPRGWFWRENPDLPYRPVRLWELWNEPNIVSYSAKPNPRRFARLMRVGGRAIHRTRPGSRVILGGLFGQPLQVPPNLGSAAFLQGVYAAGAVKRHFDGVGLHPYVSDASEMRGQIRALRRVMRHHGDGATPLYLTELGWGSARDSRWERGLYGQARELDQSFAMLARNRRAWRIGGVWWFSWVDRDTGCYFCDSAGLLTDGREGKPSWYRFNAWTGGDASGVPPLIDRP